MPSRSTRKGVLAIAALAAVAAWSLPVFAQLAVTDPPTEDSTLGTWKAVDALGKTAIDIDNQDTTTAISLTTGGGGGNFTPSTDTIANQLDGVTAQTFSSLLPGWQSCAPDCTDAGKTIDQAIMSIYQGALGVAQQQEQQRAAEGDAAGVMDSNVASTTSVLYALQGMADLLAMQVQEQRYIRQQNDTLITILVAHYGQDLNDSMQSLATKVADTPGQQQ